MIDFENVPRTNRKKIRIELDQFDGGVNKLLEEARIAKNEAKEAQNLMQVQDGLWKPRWGTASYGADVGANIDGATEYVVSSSSRELMVVAGGTLYYSTDDGSTWNSQSGATFTSGTQCFFLQINSKLYIANGTDSLALYESDGTTRSLTTFSSLSAPAWAGTPLARGAGLSTGNYTVYYQVTALNDVGETVASTEQSIAVDIERNSWTAADEYIDLDWSAVAGANRYQVYYSDEAGDEVLIDSTTDTSYRDSGDKEPNIYIETPDANTTTAPKFRSMAVSGNRIWGTNDPDNPYMVHFSGTGTWINRFSDFYGGGWINLEKGGREFPKAVVHYQTGSGQSAATVLASTPEGQGSVWQIQLSSATVGDTTFTIPSATKVVGSFGTDAQLSVVQTDNDIFFFNRRGVYSLGPEKNYFGILRTAELSSRIRPYIRNLVGSALSTVASYFYDAKVFFSVPTTGSTNNRTIYYDLERRNWVVDWTFGVKQFLEYTDSSGVTHFLYVPTSGSQLVDISDNYEGDMGSAYNTTYTSGRIPLGETWKDFVKVDNVFVKLGSPRGAIQLEVLGSGKNTGFTSVASASIVATYSLTGMGWDGMGDVQMGSTDGAPTFFSDSADKRYIKIRDKLEDIQYRITTSTLDADYTLLGIIAEGKPLRTRQPSSRKL